MKALLAVFSVLVAAFFGYTWMDTQKHRAETARLQAEAKSIEEENRRKDAELLKQAKEREQQERQRRERAEADAKQQQAKKQAQNALRNDSLRDAQAIEAILKRFGDEHAIAKSTSRIALGSRIAAMQSLRREMEALKVSDCMGIAHISAKDSMNKVIAGYLSFMSRSSAEAEAASQFSDGARSIDQYRFMRDSCLRS